MRVAAVVLACLHKKRISMKQVYDQIVAFDEHEGPTDAGGTLMGSTAQECVMRLWATVNSQGQYCITPLGREVADEVRRGIRG